MANCICQRAYDTGFTGVPAIDRRLQYHYDGWLDTDVIKRDFDHYAFGIPYVEHSSRRPYCFQERRPMRCNHAACEYARHRAPDTVKKMRFFIEQRCEASTHYPDLVENIDRSGDTRPEMDNSEHLSAQWDEYQYRLHRFALDTEREKPRKLKVISLEQFTNDVYGSLLPGYETSEDDEDEALDVTWSDVVVTFDPAILADRAAAEAADALYGPEAEQHPQDKTLERWHVWSRQREGLTVKPDAEPSWQQVAAAVGEFVAA